MCHNITLNQNLHVDFYFATILSAYVFSTALDQKC